MKGFWLTFFLFYMQTCSAQFKLTTFDLSTFPRNIQYEGNIVKAARWNDVTGDNIVLLTATGITEGKTSDYGYREASIYAYHYRVSDAGTFQTWKMYDYVKYCPVDISLYFIDNSFAVTDLNSDGKAEVWLMYKASCQADVSPVIMKIIMYENDMKFAVRGTTNVRTAPNETIGGDFSYDAAFKNGPKEFRHYAEQLWNKNRVENWRK